MEARMTAGQDQMAGEALALLRSVFGFSAFRGAQADVVQRLLGGEKLLVVMPTGGGKSLCYQIPALMLDGLTIVVSPLTALMDDQVVGLRANGVAAAAIHSGLDRSEQVDAWRAAMDGRIKLLYMSPERLMTHRMIAALQKRPPVMFVVDEVHCLSRWGVAFRPEYEMLSRLGSLFPAARIAGFTATADQATRDDIQQKLLGGGGHVLVQGFDRPNLRLTVRSRTHWRRQLLDFLDGRDSQSGVIYCFSRADTEEVAAFLQAEGFAAIAYHAGQDARTRRDAQDRFMTEPAIIMAATIAFGMGIDKPDIRYVVHLALPGSMEAYYQEIGRAGRDGAPAETLMLFSLGDLAKRRRFIELEGGDDAHQRREHKRLEALHAYADAATCRRRTLLAYFSEPLAADCGNCDNCLNPPKLRDGQRRAATLIGAAEATGGRFGPAHLIDVVRGADTAKVRDRGHDRLSVFGAGRDLSRAWWQGFVRQMMAAGLLEVDVAGHGSLLVTKRGRAVASGAEPFRYRVDCAAGQSAAPNRTAPVRSGPHLDKESAVLFDRLKATRLALAKERDVPAFVIVHDSTLADMAARKPRSRSDLLTISGMGEKKVDAFGARFLSVINTTPD